MMSNPISKFFMAAVFLYVLMISAVFADRILIDDPTQTVSLHKDFSCYQPAQITIDTVEPALYESDSNKLQTISDSVRAMLSYECPQLSSVELTGLIRGLDEVVYQGQMTRHNNWVVQSVSTDNAAISSTLQNANQVEQNNFSKRYDDELKIGQLQVIGLELGMDVKQVTQIVFDTFGIEPVYDANQGLLTLNAGNCSADTSESLHNLAVNDKCLKAWFSDNRVARLQRVNLVQVVEAQQQQVSHLMIEKYGNPTESETSDNNEVSQLIWRAINDDQDQSLIEEIDAVISTKSSNFVITDVTLYSTQQVSNSPFDHEDIAEVDLKL